VLAGRAETKLDGADVASLVERFGEGRAYADAAGALTELATERAAALTSPEPR